MGSAGDISIDPEEYAVRARHDTLIGRWVPTYTKRPKRRVIAAPKFYFSDVGAVNHLARRGRLQPGGELFGKALENWVQHEISAYLAYTHKVAKLCYWRLASGIEVDFVIDDLSAAVEVKATSKVTSDHLTGLRQLARDQPSLGTRIVVSLEPRRRVSEDGVLILPAKTLAMELAAGRLF